MLRRHAAAALVLFATACTSAASDDTSSAVAGPGLSPAADAGASDAAHAADGPAVQPALDAGADAPIDAPTDAPADATMIEDASTGVDAGMDASTEAFPVLIVGKLTGNTMAEVKMVADGVVLANDTMKTPCFKAAVLSAKWTETNGLTQAQIWDKLCSGPVTVNVDIYTGSWYENNISKTIGYENEPGTVHVNRYFVDTAYMVADNLIHEGEGHSQGFSHYGVKATSVPYGLNHAFEACSP
jgi:hypothetical protein